MGKQKNDIGRANLPKVFLTDPHYAINMRSLKDAYRDGPELLLEDKVALSPSKKFFTQTPFGRTLSGRNTAGRVVRRVGGGVLAGGLGLLGIDLGGVLAPETGSGLLPVLEQIETILLIVGGIITAIGQMIDKSEVCQERWDEREVTEGAKPLIRQLKTKR